MILLVVVSMFWSRFGSSLAWRRSHRATLQRVGLWLEDRELSVVVPLPGHGAMVSEFDVVV